MNGALSVAVIGAGFGGVGIGALLKRAGIEKFAIFERGESVGGVWRANTYPGAACDVPAHLYSFSFAHGDRWSCRYAPQDEILAYLERCVDEFGLEPHLRLGVEATAAQFDEQSGRWTVELATGERYEANVLVTACGQLARPAVPSLPGIEEFAGRAFHSAEWDHEHWLGGRDVAVVGTGASAIQFVPKIAPEVRRLTIYQRSAPWILPKMDRDYSPWEQRLFKRFPARVAASRLGLFMLLEGGTYGFTGRPWVLAPLRMIANRTRRRELPDPELRRQATPDYEIGCKRVLITSDWYSTLMRDNVELVTERIERVGADHVLATDGVKRPAEAIIYGTGFQSHRFVAPMTIAGRRGRTLDEVWGERPEAYLGTTVAGFPNMFILYGPNTNHGSGSVPYTLECQFNYVLDAIRRLRRNGVRYLDLRPEAQARWRREIERRSERSVWLAGGCNSWYLNRSGVNTNNWPGPWLEYRRRTKRLDPVDYSFA